jgi:hypothetical protein
MRTWIKKILENLFRKKTQENNLTHEQKMELKRQVALLEEDIKNSDEDIKNRNTIFNQDKQQLNDMQEKNDAAIKEYERKLNK